MDPEIVGRRDRDGNGVSRIQVSVQFHSADLDHLKNQFITDLTVGAALIGDGLVPFKVKDDVGHKNLSTQFIIHNSQFIINS